MATEIARLDAILGADISQFERAMKKADDSVVKFSNISKQFEALKPFSPYIMQGAQAAKSLTQLKDLLAQLKIEQQAAFNPKELMAYNVAIKSVTSEVKRLEGAKAGVSGVGKALNSAFSSVKSLAYLIPGLGIAGIFDLAFTAISHAAQSMGIFGKNTKEADEEMAKFAKSLNDAKAGAIKTGVELQAFVGIARDNTKSLAERNYALKEANKLMGEHGQKLTLVNINTKDATEEINKFTQALIAQAVAEKYSDKIADLIIKQTEASQAYGKALKEAKKANENYEASLNSMINAEIGDNSAKAGQVAAMSKYNKAVEDYKNVTNELRQTNQSFNENIAKSIGLFAELGTKAKETSKNIKEIDWAKWKAEMTKLSQFKPTQISTYGNILNTTNLTAEIQKQLDSGAPLKIPPFDFDKTDIGKKIADLAATIQQALEGAIAGIGESIGNLLTGQKNPFANIYKVLGEGLKAFGKQLIIVGKLAEVIQLALKNLFGPQGGFAAIAAGVAAIALGTAISNLGSGIQQHAEGGIFTQPTQIGGHLFGEKEPEALIPLSRLGNMNGGGNNIQISGRLVADGNQLVAVINATNRQNSRTYGSNFNRSNGI